MIAENAILGSILKEPFLIKEIDISPEQLTNETNKNILTAMRKLDSEEKSIDLVNLLTLGDPNSLGGAGHLQQLEAVANPEKIDEYVETVQDAWREREKKNILNIAGQENWSIDQINGELSKLVNNKASDHHQIKDLLAEVYEVPWIKQEKSIGATSGLEPLDRITGGWQDGDLIILAARPSMGKTDVMLKFAKEAGFSNRLPIVFSLEMPAERLRDRLIASIGRYDRGKFKNLERFLNKEEKSRWAETIGRVDLTNIQIFDKPRQTISEMRMKIRKSMSEHPDRKPIILVDYLTLIKPSDWMGGNMHLQVSEISKSLKGIAKEFECPVICLAQLSRAVEQRNDKRPMLSDLRESGSIEEDADVVLFLYRDSYYSQDDEDDSLELIFAKHRNGETGLIKTYYHKPTGDVSM